MTPDAALACLRAVPAALVPERLARLVQAFALSEFECELVQLCFALETDPLASRAVAELSGDVSGSVACGVPIALVHAVLGRCDWAATSPAGPLRRWQVLRAGGPAPRVQQCLRLSEAVTDALLGLHPIDPLLAGLVTPLAGDGVAPPRLTAEVAATLKDASDDAVSPLIVASWPDGRESAAAVARALGLRGLWLDVERLVASREAPFDLQRTLERDSVFDPAVLVVETPADPLVAGALGTFLTGLAAHVFVIGDLPPGCRRRVRRCHGDPPEAEDALEQWRRALGPEVSARLNGSVERVAAHFRLSPRQIADAGAAARAALQSAPDPADGERLLWGACGRAAWPQPGPLASVVEPRATLDDVIVPAPVRDELEAIVRQVRHAATVYGHWGFGACSRRGRGLTALFAGPSGTGKTLAAEAIAQALALPLVVADFSQLQSKWVGESAKLAARLFDELDCGGGVLLIDEADGLLGRRGAVVEAHDRHANADVAYLLQRLESFRGLAILTTNLKGSIDEAFVRRYRFVLEFPLPAMAERRRIWECVFPPRSPRAGLDLEALARLPLTGGTIRNVALNAAFAAAEAGKPIGPAHVLAALQSEYRKLERSPAELEASLAS